MVAYAARPSHFHAGLIRLRFDIVATHLTNSEPSDQEIEQRRAILKQGTSLGVCGCGNATAVNGDSQTGRVSGEQDNRTTPGMSQGGGMYRP